MQNFNFLKCSNLKFGTSTIAAVLPAKIQHSNAVYAHTVADNPVNYEPSQLIAAN